MIRVLQQKHVVIEEPTAIRLLGQPAEEFSKLQSHYLFEAKSDRPG